MEFFKSKEVYFKRMRNFAIWHAKHYYHNFLLNTFKAYLIAGHEERHPVSGKRCNAANSLNGWISIFRKYCLVTLLLSTVDNKVFADS